MAQQQHFDINSVLLKGANMLIFYKYGLFNSVK